MVQTITKLQRLRHVGPKSRVLFLPLFTVIYFATCSFVALVCELDFHVTTITNMINIASFAVWLM